MVAPTAFAYAGADPRTKSAEPTMNSDAIAVLSTTGRTAIMQLMLSVRRVDQAPWLVHLIT
jgi:hypothetical protein